MHIPAREDFGQHMAHLLPHAEDADGGGVGFHGFPSALLGRAPGRGGVPPNPNGRVTASALSPEGERGFASFDFEGFEHVARLDVGRRFQRDAAFQTGAHFGNIILEAPQRGDRAVVDDDIVAGDAGAQRLA
jgi:hypothetical protein